MLLHDCVVLIVACRFLLVSNVSQAIFKDTNGLFIGDVSGAMHVCLAGEACGGTLLSNKSGGGSRTPYSHGVAGYFGLYGTGQFDGQSSGHDFFGTVSIRC